MAKVIAKNVVRPLIYKHAYKVTGNLEEETADNIQMVNHTFGIGESFEIEEKYLDVLLKAYPDEISFERELATKKDLKEKEDEIAQLKEQIKKMSTADKIKNVLKKSKKAE